MDLYLVTGFLGAGKTTCISNILKQWKDNKMALIINEFGKAGVDGALLENAGVTLEEINNGSIFCSCKINRFEEVLEDVIAKEPEIILIEASGLSDPTSAYQIMRQEKFKHVNYKGCICIVDGYFFNKVIKTAKVSCKQVRMADLVIINKADLASHEQLKEVIQNIYFQNPYVTIYQTQHGQINPLWLRDLSCKDKRLDETSMRTKDITLQKYLITIANSCTLKELKKIIESFIEDTYRIKGFVELEKKYYLVDCVGDRMIIKPDEKRGKVSNQLVVLSGEGMPLAKSLARTEAMYCKQLLKVER